MIRSHVIHYVLLFAALSIYIGGLAAAEPTTISLSVDFGDGKEKKFAALPWKEGMTVLDALEAAAKEPRGITFKYRGRGATAFVTQIDDVANAGGAGKNWRFHVNGKLADQSCGVFELKAGNAVLWKFEKGN